MCVCVYVFMSLPFTHIHVLWFEAMQCLFNFLDKNCCFALYCFVFRKMCVVLHPSIHFNWQLFLYPSKTITSNFRHNEEEEKKNWYQFQDRKMIVLTLFRLCERDREQCVTKTISFRSVLLLIMFTVDIKMVRWMPFKFIENMNMIHRSHSISYHKKWSFQSIGLRHWHRLQVVYLYNMPDAWFMCAVCCLQCNVSFSHWAILFNTRKAEKKENHTYFYSLTIEIGYVVHTYEQKERKPIHK